MEQINQPHLWVVSYNETLESIKHNTLQPVSIFSDESLRKRWADTIVSLGVIVIFVFLIRIGLSIAQGSKNNLKKDAIFLLLLFFIASIFTPVFSNISELTSGAEKVYRDPETQSEYSRIYIPANTALVVNPSYRDERWNLRTYSEVFAKRSSVFNEGSNFFADDYLGIPAKIAQTQLETRGNPLQRSSRAFYSVNLDVLFSDLQWPISNFNIPVCHINLDELLSKWQGAPLSFLEALWRENWIQQYRINQQNSREHTRDLTSSVDNTRIDNSGKDLVLRVENCTLGEYFLSNEFIESYSHGLARNWQLVWPESLVQTIKENWNRDQIHHTLRNSGIEISYMSEYIRSIWPGLTYSQQKRVVYTLYAYKYLYELSLSRNTRMKDDIRVKEAMLACGRILLDRTQGNKDYKTCMVGDVFGDTTLYTQETTKNIGLLWRNTEINGGYVFPVPQNQDWDSPAYYRVGRDLTSFLQVKNYTSDKRTLWERTKDRTWRITTGILSTPWFLARLAQDFFTSDAEVKRRIEYGTLQTNSLESSSLFSQQSFKPQLASFNAYDISGSGIPDREEFASGGRQNLSPNFYGYLYASLDEPKEVGLGDKSLNYLQTPLYNTIPIEIGENKRFIAFGVSEVETVIEERDATSTSMETSTIAGERFLFYRGESNRSLWTMTFRSWDYISGRGTIGREWVVYNPNSLEKKSLDITYRENKAYNFFFTPELGSLFYRTEDFETPELLDYVLTDTWFFIGDSSVNGEGEYFLKDGIGFYHCPNLGAAQLYVNNNRENCEFKTSMWELSFSAYRSQQLTQGKKILKLFNKQRRLSSGELSSGLPVLELEIPLSRIGDYGGLYIPPGSSSYSPSTPTYSYLNIRTNTIEALNAGDHYLQANRIIQANSVPNSIGNVAIGSGGTTNVFLYNGNTGKVEDIFIEMVDFDNLWQKFPNRFTRVLLDPRVNPPLEFFPRNLFYYPEYEAVEGRCLLNPELSTENKDLFDIFPGRDKSFLEKCSMIGDHVRLTDIRLNSYVQEESLLNIGPEGESFTHVYIPLMLNEEIEEFSRDRREQTYAGEARSSESLLGQKLIEGIRIREGDIAVLKPWVVLGAYHIPYTILVTDDIIPFLSFTSVDNPLATKQRSVIYSGWIYSIMTDLVNFLKNGELAKSFLGSTVPQTEWEKYTYFLQDIYDSRPVALKSIEGVVPDRYFSAHYWAAYLTPSETKTGNNMLMSIAEFGLWLLDGVLAYRVSILEVIFVLGPLFVFFLLFEGTRKIFTLVLTITIVLLILPIIILLLVNIFS